MDDPHEAMSDSMDESKSDPTTAGLTLPAAELNTSGGEEDIAMATSQLSNLLSQLQRDKEAREIVGDISPACESTAGPSNDFERPSDVRVKKEIVSPSKTGFASHCTPHAEETLQAQQLNSVMPTPGHAHPLGHSATSSRPQTDDSTGQLEAELRVSLKRLPLSTSAALHSKRHMTGTRPNKHVQSSQDINSMKSTRPSQSSEAPRASSCSQSSKTFAPMVKSSELSRSSVTTNKKRRATAPSQEKSDSSRRKRTIDDLSVKELKALLIKSQLKIRTLTSKLNEWQHSENEVFGRLIGKMIGSIKSRRRLEGVKLHVHDLVCETVLQDMEESGD